MTTKPTTKKPAKKTTPEPKRPRDINALAAEIVGEATGAGVCRNEAQNETLKRRSRRVPDW